MSNVIKFHGAMRPSDQTEPGHLPHMGNRPNDAPPPRRRYVLILDDTKPQHLPTLTPTTRMGRWVAWVKAWF